MTRSIRPRIRERIRNSAPVKERDPRRWRPLGVSLPLLLLLSAPVLFDISQQTRCVRTRYAVEKLRAEQAALEQQYLSLRIEKASLEALGPVAERARDALGLAPARAGVRVVRSAPPEQLLASGGREDGARRAAAAGEGRSVPPSGSLVAASLHHREGR